MTTISSKDFFSKGPVSVVGNETTQQEEIAPKTSSLRSKLAERGTSLLGEVTGQPAKDIIASTPRGQEPLAAAEVLTRTAQAPIRAIGEVGGAIGDVVGAGLEATGLDKTIGNVIKPVVESTPVQKAVELYKTLPQETQDVLSSIMNTANIPLSGVGASLAKSGVESGVKTLAKGAEKVIESPAVQATMDIASAAKEGASRIPSRIATNVAEKQAEELAIKSLPSPKAQVAVRDGVDIADVTELPKLVTSSQSKKLIDTVKDFATGKTKTDPIEVVGEPIIKRLKALDTQRKEIGKKLGEASKSIGILTKPELEGGVLSRLQSVPGLENLSLTPKGLNFKGTTLESNLASAVSDRNAITSAFKEAVKWGDGEKAHRFRQTLFEDLGGKKKSLTNMTDTQERGYEAIRQGLSDVIETKSPTYKTVSNEYRKIVQPISDLRKLMKNIDPSASDDILNMSAGLLARRITSAAASNPQIKQILKSLDEAGTKGNVKESVSQLQDLYNILNKYYDIAPKTGYQNLTKQATSDSLTGTIKETVRDVAGRSSAVRQKALEDLLDELFQ